MNTLRAGAASADITPPAGVMMDGYGGRFEPSQGVHDPLFARALVLDYDDTSSAHGEALEPRAEPQRIDAAAIVVLDLLGIHPWMAAELRRRAHETLGIPEDAVVLSATHDHAAPVGLRSGMFSRLDEELAEKTVAACLDALTRAWESRQPATLKAGSIDVPGVGMNRRDPDGPVDPTLRVLLLDGEDGPVASLMNFACHATVLTGANLLLSARVPRRRPAASSKRRPAHPPSTSRAPAATLTRPGSRRTSPAWSAPARQSRAAALSVIADLRAAGGGLRAHNIRWDEFPETGCQRVALSRRACGPSAARSTSRCAISSMTRIRRAHRSSEGGGGRQPCRLTGETRRDGATLPLRRRALGRGLGTPLRRVRHSSHRGAGDLARATASRSSRCPASSSSRRPRMIREGSGLEELLVAGYANDYIGYVVPEHAFAEGGYESGVTFFTGEAEAIIRNVSAGPAAGGQSRGD